MNPATAGTGAARGGAARRRGRVPQPRRAPPLRAARPLLPDARLGSRRRGRAPGRPAAGVARAAPVRGAQLASLLALPDRHQRLPGPDRAAAEAGAAGRLRPGRRSARRPRRRPTQPLVETVWMEPYPDEKLGLEDGFAAPEARYEQRESVELAFVAALQHLPPNQRAALILREVLGFSAREVAESLDTTTASVNSALQRARVDGRGADPGAEPAGHPARARRRAPERDRRAATREALEQGDVDALLGMLTEDATWSMPPLPNWYRGHEAIAGFLRKGPFTVRWRHAPDTRERAAGGRLLHVGRGAAQLRRLRPRRAHPARRADRRGHGLPRPLDLRALRPAGRAARVARRTWPHRRANGVTP